MHSYLNFGLSESILLLNTQQRETISRENAQRLKFRDNTAVAVMKYDWDIKSLDIVPNKNCTDLVCCQFLACANRILEVVDKMR